MDTTVHLLVYSSTVLNLQFTCLFQFIVALLHRIHFVKLYCSCLVSGTSGNISYVLCHGSVRVHSTCWGQMGYFCRWATNNKTFPDLAGSADFPGSVKDYTLYSKGTHIILISLGHAFCVRDKQFVTYTLRKRYRLYLLTANYSVFS